jgi:cell division protein FtsB
MTNFKKILVVAFTSLSILAFTGFMTWQLSTSQEREIKLLKMEIVSAKKEVDWFENEKNVLQTEIEQLTKGRDAFVEARKKAVIPEKSFKEFGKNVFGT